MIKKLVTLLIIGGAAVACSSTRAPKQEVASAPVASEPVASAPVASAPMVDTTPTVSNHNSVYFAFDKYDIQDGYTGIVNANGQYLANTPSARVQIQGNTDDIGSVEYNLALGQRRADAVKKALVADGASRHQVEAISYGKLKPKYSNDDATNRSKNRRSDIMYKSAQPNGYTLDMNGLPMVDGSFYNGSVIEGVVDGDPHQYQ